MRKRTAISPHASGIYRDIFASNTGIHLDRPKRLPVRVIYWLSVRTGSPIYITTEIMQQKGVGSDVLEKELGLGPIHPDESVGNILKEFEETRKAHQVKMQAKEEEEAKDKKE